MKTIIKDNLKVKIFDTRSDMGKDAARDIHDRILSVLSEKDEINMIFAAAPSQNDVLYSLAKYDDIPWNKINAFHMDEYIGLSKEAPQGFGNFLMKHIFGLVPFKSINLIDSENQKNPEKECERYGKLLEENPTDIVVMGIGENGHIAFNDPPVADFNDKKRVKIVELDEICRNQQVNDGCFESIEKVPKTAITLTCPTLMSAKYVFCIVPASTKANAVKLTLTEKIEEKVPATVLRRHKNAILYLDGDSSALI